MLINQIVNLNSKSSFKRNLITFKFATDRQTNNILSVKQYSLNGSTGKPYWKINGKLNKIQFLVGKHISYIFLKY